MKSFCAVIIAGFFFLQGCAPSPVVGLSLTGQKWKAPEGPLDLVAGVSDFTVEEGTPEKFSTHFSFSELEFEKPLASLVSDAFRRSLKDSGVFLDVVKDGRNADLVISGHVRKSHWRDRGSMWKLFWLSSLTFDLYPVFGGALAWPEAEVELVVTLSKPSGVKFRAYGGRGKISQALSMYSFSEVTPAVQLARAMSDAIREIERKIYRDGEIIMHFVRPAPLPKPDPSGRVIEKPGISITYPPDGGVTGYSRINFRAFVTGEVPLANYRIYINDAAVRTGALDGTTVELEQVISLHAGKNTIRLVVDNSRGGAGEAEVTVRYDPPRITTPRRWILLVSVEPAGKSRRPFQGFIRKLVLHPEGGFARERVMEIRGPGATRRNIFAAIRLFLKRAGVKDEIFVFFAGGGISLGSTPEMNFLTCADTNVRDLEKTAVSLQALKNELESGLRCPNICGIYCLERAGSGESNIDPGLVKSTMGAPPSRAVMVAAPAEKSDDSRFEAWWSALELALGPEADGDQDAVLTLKEFFSYLEARKGFASTSAIHGWKDAKLLVLKGEKAR